MVSQPMLSMFGSHAPNVIVAEPLGFIVTVWVTAWGCQGQVGAQSSSRASTCIRGTVLSSILSPIATLLNVALISTRICCERVNELVSSSLYVPSHSAMSFTVLEGCQLQLCDSIVQ